MDLASKGSLASSSSSSSRGTAGNANGTAHDLAPSVPSFRASDHFANIMVEFEASNTEMAVDVPDSFVAQTKTPPKYPPPLPKGNILVNGGDEIPPALLSRDHLRIEKDGHLLNTQDAPGVVRNGHINSGSLGRGPSGSIVQPTEQQSLRMKKYSEDIKRKNLELEKRKESQEMLRLSIRNSKKMNALKEGAANGAEGVANGAFTLQEHQVQNMPDLDEVMKALGRLEAKLGSEKVGGVTRLFQTPEVQRAVIINQKVIST